MNKELRDIVKIDEELCDGCGLCLPGCAEGAIEIRQGKAGLVADKFCDGLGACLGHCPRGAITIIKRQADAFDEESVEERLSELKKAEQNKAMQTEPATKLGCGCPGSAMATFAPAGLTTAKKTGTAHTSSLNHWPVQIRLIPPHAPFLKGADILVAADCAPVAYPLLHQELLPGKVIMLGCPKFDDANDYLQRFVDIFKQAGINSVTVLSMEVPCCAGLGQIVRRAVSLSGREIQFEEIKVSRQGEILSQAQDENPDSAVFHPADQQFLNP